MIQKLKCPVCHNLGIEIELKEDEKAIFSGRQLKAFPFFVFCDICKRKIRFDIESEKTNG